MVVYSSRTSFLLHRLRENSAVQSQNRFQLVNGRDRICWCNHGLWWAVQRRVVNRVLCLPLCGRSSPLGRRWRTEDWSSVSPGGSTSHLESRPRQAPCEYWILLLQIWIKRMVNLLFCNLFLKVARWVGLHLNKATWKVCSVVNKLYPFVVWYID